MSETSRFAKAIVGAAAVSLERRGRNRSRGASEMREGHGEDGVKTLSQADRRPVSQMHAVAVPPRPFCHQRNIDACAHGCPAGTGD